MNPLPPMTDEVVEWVSEIFPDRHPMHTTIKMVEEVSELMDAVFTGGRNVGEECADVLILLLDIAHLTGVDLHREFKNKMAVNRNRKWVKRNGALKHDNPD
jgi:NTP pyrophosphatase (non-canonical NTP hydrolase)